MTSDEATIEKLKAEAAKIRAETDVIKAKGESHEAAIIAKMFAEHDQVNAQTRYHGLTVIVAAMLAGATTLAAGMTLAKLLDIIK